MKTRHDYWDEMLWARRKHLFHFQRTVDWLLEVWDPRFESVREIGCHDHGILPLLRDQLPDDAREQVKLWHAVDLTRLPDFPWMETSRVDAAEHDFDPVDVTICQHVIQHVKDAPAFFAKLERETRAWLVLGGTYKANPTPQPFPDYPPDHHIFCRHFGIDREKVVGWACGQKPERWAVKTESGLSRWMGLWKRGLARLP